MPKSTPPNVSARRATRSQGSVTTSAPGPCSPSATADPPSRRSGRLAARSQPLVDSPIHDEKPSNPALSPRSSSTMPSPDRKPSLKNAAVPAPSVERLPSALPGPNHEHRSDAGQARQSEKKSRHNAKRWLETCPVFIDRRVTVETLRGRGKNKPGDKAKAEAKIAEMRHCEADAGSLAIVDKNGILLLAYFSHNFTQAMPADRRGPTLGEFLRGTATLESLPEYPGPQGRTENDVTEGMAHDGLQEGNLERTHIATQNVFHDTQPVANARDKRHPDDNFMAYRSDLQARRQDEEGSADLREGMAHTDMVYERSGVHHLVHGWPMLGHEDGYLYPSRDMARSSLGMLSISGYYLATEGTTLEVSHRFQVAFPEYFSRYSRAFRAGVVNLFDKGPFLGRALVWKMQVNAHQDGKDEGPAAIFPCGYYRGGYLYIPDLGLKLAYRPSDLAILLAGHLFHGLDQWEPGPVPHGKGVSPGRVSTVFFFPHDSYKRLDGKPEFWNARTMSGLRFTCA